MPGRGNVLKYGKIELASESAGSMGELTMALEQILSKHGYPEAGFQKMELDEVMRTAASEAKIAHDVEDAREDLVRSNFASVPETKKNEREDKGWKFGSKSSN